MLSQLPRRALLRFEFPIRYIARPPALCGDVRDWDAKYLAPPLVELEDAEPIADVYWAWNEDGFYAAFDVPNRPGRPQCDTRQWWKQDGVRLCIDTRDARDIKRGTRFCHLFYALPLGGGSRGAQPVLGTHHLSRAKEHPPTPDLARARVSSVVDARHYTIEMHLPAACLNGWDPVEHPRIGIYYKVRDTRLGDQHLSADDELGWNADPSTWATGVLVK